MNHLCGGRQSLLTAIDTCARRSLRGAHRLGVAPRHPNPLLRRAKRAGRPPQLDEAQLKRLVRLLEAGPGVAGFATGLWTLPRVRQVIERQFGVRFGTTRVWQLLHGPSFSPQRPARAP